VADVDDGVVMLDEPESEALTDDDISVGMVDESEAVELAAVDEDVPGTVDEAESLGLTVDEDAVSGTVDVSESVGVSVGAIDVPGTLDELESEYVAGGEVDRAGEHVAQDGDGELVTSEVVWLPLTSDMG
jgi:hypothetical protein